MKVKTEITFDWNDLKRLVAQELHNTMAMTINPDQVQVMEDDDGNPYITIVETHGE